jgi:hypothetical protein
VTIVDALEDAAAGLDDVERRDTAADGVVEWTAAGVVFAAVTGDIAEFRLDPAVASAALGTADTGPSRRGPDWVAFSPPVLDRLAHDRAVAWFGSAYRRAATAPSARRESRRPR